MYEDPFESVGAFLGAVGRNAIYIVILVAFLLAMCVGVVVLGAAISPLTEVPA